MTKKIKNGKTIITHILLMIFALIQIYPLFWLFEFSLKDNSEILVEILQVFRSTGDLGIM